VSITAWGLNVTFPLISSACFFSFFLHFSEQSIAQARAFVMLYNEDRKEWEHSGGSSRISLVHVYHHPVNNTYRIVGRKVQDHTVQVCQQFKMLFMFAHLPGNSSRLHNVEMQCRVSQLQTKNILGTNMVDGLGFSLGFERWMSKMCYRACMVIWKILFIRQLMKKQTIFFKKWPCPQDAWTASG